MTNMSYSDAPGLTPNSVTSATNPVWHELALTGDTAHDFDEQITELQRFLVEHWRARLGENSGNPVYEKPVVLVIGAGRWSMWCRASRTGWRMDSVHYTLAGCPPRSERHLT